MNLIFNAAEAMPKGGRISLSTRNCYVDMHISGFDKVLRHYPPKSPLRRNIRAHEVGNAGLYLLSDLSSGVTGEIHYVDAGYNIVGW